MNKEAKKLIKENEKEHCEFRKSIKEMHGAVFGNGNGDAGIKRQVDEMYPVVMELKNFLTGTEFGTKVIRNTAAFLASLAVAIYVIWKVIHGQNPF